MKRIVNFRYLFFPFISFLVSIILSKYIFCSNYVVISLICMFFAVYLLFAIRHSKCFQYILILIFFLLGIFAFFISVKTYASDDILGENQISARVKTEIYRASSYQIVILDNVEVGEKKLSDNIKATFYISSGKSFLRNGDKISFTADINLNNLFELGEVQTYNYKNDIPYYVNLSLSQVEVKDNNLGFFEKIRKSVKDKLSVIMTPDNSAISYAILFGDTSEIDGEIKDNYSTSGIAHLLSISGLHIGVIVAFLFFILKKLKAKNLTKLIVTSVVLVFYCFLCGFTSPVVRTTLMSLILILSSTLGKGYDSLNSIGLSGLIILCFKPLYAFDLGFLLSYFSVIFILLFGKTFRKWFSKIKIPKVISSSLAMTLSASIGTLPLVLKYFNSFSLLVVFANLIAIPLFSFAFIVVVIFTPLIFIFPTLSSVLWISDYSFELINRIAEFFANIPNSLISITLTMTSLIFAYYLIFYLFSRVVSMKISIKLVTSISVVIIAVISSFICKLPANFTENSYSEIKSTTSCFITTELNQRILIEKEKFNDENVRKYLEYRNVKIVDYFVVFAEQTDLLSFREFILDYKIKKVICCEDNYDNLKLVNLESITKISNKFELDENITLSFVKPYLKNNVLELKIDQTNMLVFKELTEVETENFELMIYDKNQKIDFVCGKLPNYNLQFIDKETNIVNGKNSLLEKNINLLNYGNFTFNFKNDNIFALRTID